MSQKAKITPIAIPKPSLADKAGYLFGLKSVVKNAAGRKAAAERMAKQDPQGACRSLEQVERILAWTPKLDKDGSFLLESAMAFHASILVTLRKNTDAARLLLAARRFGNLSRQIHALAFLAEQLGAIGDTAEEAIGIYMDHLAAAAKVNKKPSPSAYAILGKLSIPVDPLHYPSEQQRAMLKRIEGASRSCGLAVYGMAICAYHEGNDRVAYDRICQVQKTGEFAAQVDYLLPVLSGRLALAGGDCKRALAEFEKAHAVLTDHADALLGIIEATAVCIADAHSKGDAAADEIKGMATRAKQAAGILLKRTPGDAVVLRLAGRICLLTNELDQAARLLEMAIKQAPEPEAFADLAVLHLRNGDPKAAKKIAAEGAQAFPTSVDILLVLGEAAEAMEDWSTAADAYNKASGLQSDNTQAATRAGHAFFMLGNSESAIKILESAAKSENREAKYWLARAQLRSGDVQSAAELLSELCKSEPSYSEILYGASALAQAGRHDEALTLLSSAEESYPQDTDFLILYAKVLTAMGQVDEARDKIEQVRKLKPDHPELDYAEACLAYRTGDVETAESLVSACAEANQNSPLYSLAMAMICLRRGDNSEAEAYLNKYDPAAPGDPKARSLRGLALGYFETWAPNSETTRPDVDLWLEGKFAAGGEAYAGALSYWQALAERYPQLQRLALNINRLYFLLGRQLIEKGDYAGAIAAWQKFAELRPDDEALKLDLAELWLRLAFKHLSSLENGSLDQARRALAEAAVVEKQSGRAHLYQAIADLRGGNVTRAVEHLKRAKRNGHKHVSDTALLWLGLALTVSSDYQGALEILTQLLKAKDTSLRAAAKHAIALVHGKMGDWKDAAEMAGAAISERSDTDVEPSIPQFSDKFHAD